MTPADEMRMWIRHALHNRALFWHYRRWIRLRRWARADAKECRRHRESAWWAISRARQARAQAAEHAERIAA